MLELYIITVLTRIARWYVCTYSSCRLFIIAKQSKQYTFNNKNLQFFLTFNLQPKYLFYFACLKFNFVEFKICMLKHRF